MNTRTQWPQILPPFLLSPWNKLKPTGKATLVVLWAIKCILSVAHADMQAFPATGAARSHTGRLRRREKSEEQMTENPRLHSSVS